MSRTPSLETQVRSLRRQLAEEEQRAVGFMRERDIYRVRATKAEQECAEWKARFDKLLERTPKEPS
mgnify:CR=1 FL=1